MQYLKLTMGAIAVLLVAVLAFIYFTFDYDYPT